MTSAEPVIGNWYQDESGRRFEVLDVDEPADTVDIQYEDGTLDRYDLSMWAEAEVEPAEPPEEWSEALEPPIDSDDADEDQLEQDWPEDWPEDTPENG